MWGPKAILGKTETFAYRTMVCVSKVSSVCWVREIQAENVTLSYISLLCLFESLFELKLGSPELDFMLRLPSFSQSLPRCIRYICTCQLCLDFKRMWLFFVCQFVNMCFSCPIFQDTLGKDIFQSSCKHGGLTGARASTALLPPSCDAYVPWRKCGVTPPDAKSNLLTCEIGIWPQGKSKGGEETSLPGAAQDSVWLSAPC